MAAPWSLHPTPATLRVATSRFLPPTTGPMINHRVKSPLGRPENAPPPFSTVEARGLLFSFLRKQFCRSHGGFSLDWYHLLPLPHTSAPRNKCAQWALGRDTGSKSHNLHFYFKLSAVCHMDFGLRTNVLFSVLPKFGTKYQMHRSTGGSHGLSRTATTSRSDPGNNAGHPENFCWCSKQHKPNGFNDAFIRLDICLCLWMSRGLI